MPIVHDLQVLHSMHFARQPQAAGPTTTSSPGTTTSTPDAGGTPPMSMTMPGAPSSTSSASSTSGAPFFPSPTATNTSGEHDDSSLRSTKNAVEGALIAVAVVGIIALCVWRCIRLRRRDRPITHFFRAQPEPDVPARPRSVPRTTGLPPVPAPPESVIYDTLAVSSPVPLAHRTPRRGRTRRTRAGDIDTAGRRGAIAHPDDPEEFLPEYDDKDVLPRYQDIHRDRERADAGAGARSPGPGVGTQMEESRSPNREGGTSDTIPLVTRVPLSGSATLEEQAQLSSGSHSGHEEPRSHQQD